MARFPVDPLTEIDLTNEWSTLNSTELRGIPGFAHGGERLPRIRGRWLDPTGRIGLFPAQVADRMRGVWFENWRDFREMFWRIVARTPELAEGWSMSNLERMRKGYAPFAGKLAIGGGANAKYHLNHIEEISAGGGLYDLDNIEVTSPGFNQDVRPRYR